MCANIVLITGKVRYAIYLHMALIYLELISGLYTSGRYTILTEIIFCNKCRHNMILKAKTVFIIKDDTMLINSTSKRNFVELVLLCLWFIGLLVVDAIAY